jgi:hypothetical protein
MSVKTRHQERVEYFAVFLRALLDMDKELAVLFCQWSIAGAMLVLAYQGKMSGGLAGGYSTIIIGIDVVRLFALFRDMKQSGELDQRLDEQ